MINLFRKLFTKKQKLNGWYKRRYNYGGYFLELSSFFDYYVDGEIIATIKPKTMQSLIHGETPKLIINN